MISNFFYPDAFLSHTQQIDAHTAMYLSVFMTFYLHKVSMYMLSMWMDFRSFLFPQDIPLEPVQTADWVALQSLH